MVARLTFIASLLGAGAVAGAWVVENGLRSRQAPAPSSATSGNHSSLLSAKRIERLTGDYGLQPFKYRGRPGRAHVRIDARGVTFIVANSRTAEPRGEMGCRSGSAPLNRYPFTVEDAPGTMVTGGIFVGRVPQYSDWTATYCNSAAVHVKNSGDTVIDATRIAGAWDGVRASSGSPNLTLTRSWLSDVRDDAVENDYLHSITIEDTLIDGAFQGVSMKRWKGATAAGSVGGSVKVSGLLLRLKEYPYRGSSRFGALIKSDETAPRIRMDDSVVAIDYRGGASWRSYWSRTWGLVEGRNNLLLWLSDLPMPESFVPPPPESGFRLVKGDVAARMWAGAVQNWIDCHPEVNRTSDDPRSRQTRCNPELWGNGHRGKKSASSH